MKTLLIVDDQPGIRMLLEELFKQETFNTKSAESGGEALRIIQKNVPDLVLLDMKMPGIDGIEVLKRIKREWPHIPVIMMTAYGEVELTEQAAQLGADRYFTKPFDIFEVRSAVQALFAS